LPTIDELQTMSILQDKIKLKSSTKYWSSNNIQQSTNTLYYYTSKQPGFIGTAEKTNQLNGNVMLIRPIRYF